jgi:hypothetical protein
MTPLAARWVAVLRCRQQQIPAVSFGQNQGFETIK